MTERHSHRLGNEASTLSIGPSSLSWEGDQLVIDLDEITTPIPTRIRGRLRLHPSALANTSFALDREARHHWTAIAPCARIEVDLEKPGLRWSGSAYFDSNAGTVPLEKTFSHWDWSRTSTSEGTAVLYDVTPHNGDAFSLALKFNARGEVSRLTPPLKMRLPNSGWNIKRSTRSDAGQEAKVIKTLEDTPFYARSLVSAQLCGERVTAVHESLSLDRFRSNWVQCLLPFRMPRALR